MLSIKEINALLEFVAGCEECLTLAGYSSRYVYQPALAPSLRVAAGRNGKSASTTYSVLTISQMPIPMVEGTQAGMHLIGMLSEEE